MSEALISEDLLRENWPEALAPENAIIGLSVHITEAARKLSSEILRSHDLSPAEFEVLFILRANQRQSPSLLPKDVHEAMFMTTGGISKVLRRLEERGLIERPSSSGDARQRPIALTSRGTAVAENAFGEIGAAYRAAVGKAITSDEDKQRALSWMMTLKHAL